MTMSVVLSNNNMESSTSTVDPVSGSSSSLLQELIKDPLNLLYRFYHSTTRMSEDLSNQTPENKTENELVQERTESPTLPQRRLHPKAEDCRSSLLAGTASVVLKKSDNENIVEFMDLPVGVVLHIASYLDAKSLCHLQQTCHQLHSLMSDELLWRQRLWKDSHQWPVVGHLSHPKVYQEASADMSAQEIYSSCFVNRTSVPTQHSFSYPLTQKLRSFMRRLQGHVPRLLMFGSGLETVPLIKRMIMDTNSPYKPAGMFPGKDGIGSGVCLKHKNTSVNLVTLYTATKAERTATAARGQRINKLISAYNEDDQSAPDLTAAVQEQCQMADGFILAVDSSNINEQGLDMDKIMLKAMLHSGAQRAPLLVLSCQFQPSEVEDLNSTMPSLDVADRLKLCDINHPWQVRTLNLQTFEGLEDGLDWLLTASNS